MDEPPVTDRHQPTKVHEKAVHAAALALIHWLFGETENSQQPQTPPLPPKPDELSSSQEK